MEILNKNDIVVGQCYELYNILGGDEDEALKGIVLKNNDDEEDEILGEDKFIKRRRMNYD